MKHGRIMAVVATLSLMGMACLAATHYVVPPGTPGATATDPYTNWTTAATNLIDVVNAALTNAGGKLIWVTNGTYYPTNSMEVANATSLRLQSVNGRDVTILDGSHSTNRCIQFDWLSNYGVFDGFTVTNFSGTISSAGIVHGGIITVVNCLFAGNSNLNSDGGGVHVDLGGATITNCIFRNNYARQSGGAVNVSLHHSYPSLVTRIMDCRFEGNRAYDYYGGALFSSVRNNIISNCVFVNNSASSRGGAIYLGLYGTNDLVVNCTFTGNIVDCKGAEKAGYGGGIYNIGKTTIRNCSIIGNITTNAGGGIYAGMPADTNATIINCLIARNQATTNIGGGIWMTNTTLVNCTIVSNYAAVAGGGVYAVGPENNGTNNIIYFNTAASVVNFTNTAGNMGLNYSCVIPSVNGTGNITNNPVLKDLAGGDYRLRMTSPCVNAGTNQPWMTNAVDLAGNARILKIIVDMGAYETRIWQGTIFSVP